ncbi:VanZ family protein [Cytobacillus purgationiresistens]|uniref:Glycopeptide antibiotics resistance protein n=1 Tax=Cytobacillus purgationiresistens TaxID=863449 RepID=A0ABU0AIX6_9BACI|nr:VanZ family protein [Cytobacillus purgationiresistens]MDQ0270990.1 glycopeptide antibiotics resistance protein [Cytobacillus purgationiresistens]
MHQGNLRKITIVLLTLYTALTLYFLYLGFNRSFLWLDSSLRFNLIPEGIPLHYPMGKDFQIWFFEYGNFLAFIPFGMIIPLLFRCSFRRFITFFILSITILETLQMLSRLGAFDINDIIINSLGAAVGFAAQRIVTDDRDKLKGICKMFLIAIVLALGTIIIVGGINNYLEKGEGETVALNELILKDGSIQWDENLSSFTVAQKEVTPQINLYSRKNTKTNEFSYLLDGKYKDITGYVAIPDDVINAASTEVSEIEFISGGTVIYSVGLSAKSGENQEVSFQVPLNEVNDFTIKIINEDPNLITNAVMWDITITEVNAGQEIINRIREKIRSLF